ncbi:hypothetical protein OQA88_4968 [Cercophora sp. LCS_1]
MEEEENTAREKRCSSGEQPSEAGTQIYTPDNNTFREHTFEYVDDGDYSESVYSTDELEPTYDQSRQRRRRTREDFASLETPLTYQPAGHRDNSSGSSIDWKTWLSANVAKFDSSPTKSRLTEIEFALPTMPKNFSGGHIRESTQIHEGLDEDAKTPEPPTHKPTLPTTPLATVETNVVKASPRQRSIKHLTPPGRRSSLHENDSPSQAPPIPPKSILRSIPSPLKRARSNLGNMMSPSISSSPGLSAAVQRQFGPVSGRTAVGSGARNREATDGWSNEWRHGRSYHQTTASSEEGGAFI